MKTLSDRLKNSALNNLESSLPVEKRDSEVVIEPLSEKKAELKSDFDLSENLELEALKKKILEQNRELENQKRAYQELESKKIVNRSFKQYTAKTVRITEEHVAMMDNFVKDLPSNVDRFEKITINSFYRAILENILSRKDSIDLLGVSTEDDLVNEINKIFK